MEMTFDTFDQAADWCAANDVAMGPREDDHPIGLMYCRDAHIINPYSQILPDDHDKLDGWLTGDMTNGPVTISIRPR